MLKYKINHFDVKPPYIREDGSDKRLSYLEQKVFNYIALCLEEKGKPPTMTEIQKDLNLKGHSSSQHQLLRLKEKGFIDWTKNRKRSIRILPENHG